MTWAPRGHDVRPKPELRPAQHDHGRGRAGARLRTAWNATWGSSEHAWTTRSPPLRGGVELVAGRRAAVGERVGPVAGEPEPILAVRRTRTVRSRSSRSGSRAPGPAPRRCRSVARARLGAGGPTGPPCGHRRRRRGPRAQQLDQTSASRRVVTSNAANRGDPARRGDARLVRAVEGHGVAAGASGVVTLVDAACRGDAADPAAGPPSAQHRPPGQTRLLLARLLGVIVMPDRVPPTFDSGSANASTRRQRPRVGRR